MESFALDDLRRLGRTAYERVGVPAADAAVVVDVQLDADSRGVDTHGFQRLPWYVRDLRDGRLNPTPALTVVRESSVSLLLDVDNALGQLACVRLMERTMAKAAQSGLAVGVSRRSNDWGCGAHYPLMAAGAGFVAFATTTSVPTLAPFGARTRVLGNNPMVFAVPRPHGSPIVLDMALTPVALGKVMRARAEAEPIPEEWGFLDTYGRPTTDPTVALGGIIPAIGGYKGTGLSVMMNVLAGVIGGGAHTGQVGVGHRGQFMFVLSPELFGDGDEFADRVEQMAAQVKGAEPLPLADGVFLPGEPEAIRAAAVAQEGRLSYPQSVVDELAAMADSLEIEFPWGES